MFILILFYIYYSFTFHSFKVFNPGGADFSRWCQLIECFLICVTSFSVAFMGYSIISGSIYDWLSRNQEALAEKKNCSRQLPFYTLFLDEFETSYRGIKN